MYDKYIITIFGERYLLDYNTNEFCLDNLKDLLSNYKYIDEKNFEELNEELMINYDSQLTPIEDITEINLDD